jgi:hypothetical protein
MITAKNIRHMIDLSVESLRAIAVDSKINGLDITGAEFLGMTNSGEFCYRIIHWSNGESVSAKMFVKYNPVRDMVTATIG